MIEYDIYRTEFVKTQKTYIIQKSKDIFQTSIDWIVHNWIDVTHFACIALSMLIFKFSPLACALSKKLCSTFLKYLKKNHDHFIQAFTGMCFRKTIRKYERNFQFNLQCKSIYLSSYLCKDFFLMNHRSISKTRRRWLRKIVWVVKILENMLP